MDSDSLVGREVAGYRIEEIIGRGGMGVVYRAEHIRLGRNVALKVVAPQIAREPKFRERFLRESRTAGSLDHPNVVPLYDAGEADEVLYIAMRWVDGVDLASLIASEGKLEATRVARIVAQVASALDAAHEAGLVHRDVKPSNVLLPARGAGRGEHAYLGDFGLTKRVLSESGVTGSSAFLGTIAYVAPEQIEGRAVDAKADQYSLACLVYECLTGHRPFERDTDIATLYAHIRDPFPSVGDAAPAPIQGDLDAVVARAAAKKPTDRYESCGEFAEELTRVTGASAVSTPVARASRRRGPARSRRRGLLIGLGSALAVAAVGIAAFVLIQGQGPDAPVVPGNGVAIIDPATNTATLAAVLPAAPTAVAADASAAWVVHFATNAVTRVDGSTRATSSITVGTGPVAAVAGDESGFQAAQEDPRPRVWVTNATSETLSEINVEDLDLSPASQHIQFRGSGLAVGGGFVWIIDAQNDSLRRIEGSAVDPNPIDVGQEPVSVVASDAVVWVANRLDSSLSRLQIGLSSTDAPTTLDFLPGAMALDTVSGMLWLVDEDGDEVVRFDTGSRDLEARIPVRASPVAVAVGAGAVWVANSGDGTVSRIDPATDLVMATISVGGSPIGIAVVGDTVWVVVAEN